MGAQVKRRPIVCPRRLRSGDVIGLISPSSPAAPYQRRLDRGREALQQIGLETVLAPHCLADLGHIAGTPKQRASDINDLFAAPGIAGIFATTGGLNANQLLPHLDWGLITANPKVMMGYSDVSVLLLAIWARTGLATVHGPCLLPHFGEFGGLHPYTRTSFERTLMHATPAGLLGPSHLRIEERLWWDQEDTRLRKAAPDPGPCVLRRGRAEGPLIAGNIGSMLTLSGTAYWPDLTGHILFLEEDEAESPGTIERMLAHLTEIGTFAQASGVAFGRFHRDVGLDLAGLAAIVERTIPDTGLPVVANLDFGHTDPMFLLPFGTHASLDASDRVAVTLTEAAVVDHGPQG